MNYAGRYQLMRHRAVLKSLLKSTYSQLNYINTIVKEFDDPEDRVLIKDTKKILLADFLDQLESIVNSLDDKIATQEQEIKMATVSIEVVEANETTEFEIETPQREIATYTVEVDNRDVVTVNSEVKIEEASTIEQVNLIEHIVEAQHETPGVFNQDNIATAAQAYSEDAAPGTIIAKMTSENNTPQSKTKKRKNKTAKQQIIAETETTTQNPRLGIPSTSSSQNIAKYADLILSHKIVPYKDYIIEINTETQQLKIDLRRLELETDYLVTRAEIEQFPDTPQIVYDALFSNTLQTLEMTSPVQVKIAQTIIKFIHKVTDFNFSKLTHTRNYLDAMAWMQISYRKYLTKTYGKDYITVPAQ